MAGSPRGATPEIRAADAPVRHGPSLAGSATRSRSSAPRRSRLRGPSRACTPARVRRPRWGHARREERHGRLLIVRVLTLEVVSGVDHGSGSGHVGCEARPGRPAERDAWEGGRRPVTGSDRDPVGRAPRDGGTRESVIDTPPGCAPQYPVRTGSGSAPAGSGIHHRPLCGSLTIPPFGRCRAGIPDTRVPPPTHSHPPGTRRSRQDPTPAG